MRAESQKFFRWLLLARWLMVAFVGGAGAALASPQKRAIWLGILGFGVAYHLLLTLMLRREQTARNQSRWVLVGAILDLPFITAGCWADTGPGSPLFYWLLIPAAQLSLFHPSAVAGPWAFLAAGVSLLSLFQHGPWLNLLEQEALSIGLHFVLLPLVGLGLHRLNTLARRAHFPLEAIQAVREGMAALEEEPLLIQRATRAVAGLWPVDVCLLARSEAADGNTWIASRPLAAEAQPFYQALIDLARGRSVVHLPDTSIVETLSALAPPHAALLGSVDFLDGTYGALVVVAAQTQAFPPEAPAVFLEVAQEIGTRIRTCRRLATAREQMALDPLTLVLNRERWLQALSEEIRRARRFARPFSLLLCNIRQMTEYNRIHGYALGDHLLSRVAQLLRERARKTDRVGRWEGDKLGVLLPEAHRTQAEECARRLQQVVERTLIWPDAGPPRLRQRAQPRPERSVQMSYAIATYPDDGDLPLALIDVALQRLRAGGRGSG